MYIARFVLAIGLIFLLLLASEVYWHRHKTHGEFSRKFIHITVGSFVAFWPFFLSWGHIQLLSIALLLVVALSKYLKIFKAIHNVQRPTGGELFFAAAIGLTTILTHNKYIFAAALLHMSLADGLAAIIGTHYGRKNRYFVSGHAKSLAGSLAFAFVSLAILGGYGLMAGVTLPPLTMVSIALTATAIENIGLYGLDNLLLPLMVAAILKYF